MTDKNKKEKLLLIDGYSIANRAYYALPKELSNSRGVHTGAVLGFLNIFFSVYEKTLPDYIIAAFDVRKNTFRHDLYKEYKGNRKPMPEEIHEQIPIIKDALNKMGVQCAELSGYEADDIIGTLSRRAEGAGLDVVILSGDRDLLQLATDSTLVAIPKTKGAVSETELYYSDDVFNKYGVTPSEFIQMKALMGDSSDNIPGIPGIGEKTAAAIIKEYKTLENAYENVSKIKPPKASKNLSEFIEQGRLSLKLSEIVTDAPVDIDIKNRRINAEDDLFNDDVYALFKELELSRLLERFGGFFKKSSSFDIDYENAADCPEALNISGSYAGISVFKEGLAFAISYYDGDNIKTRVYEGFKPELLKSLALGFKKISCFDLKEILHTAMDNQANDDADSFTDLFTDTCADSYEDVQLMAYIANPLASSYSYDIIASSYLGFTVPSKKDLLGKLDGIAAFEKSPENAKMLCAYEAYVSLLAFSELNNALDAGAQTGVYEIIEKPLLFSLYKMEKAGITVRRDILDSFSDILSKEEASLCEEIYSAAGEKFNINSPLQLGNILFEKLKMPRGKKNKNGYSTSADILEKLAADFPIAGLVLKYRQYSKLRSTYAEGLAGFIKEDGRIHGKFNQTVTATGRISSADPNLQNIPIRTELGAEIRKAFVAKEGYILLDADYSQIELRLLAHLSGDKNLIRAYQGDTDIHKVTASKVYGVPLPEVSEEQRRNAKAVNFGIIYGISSFGLSQGLSITRAEAERFIKQYYETYPGVKKYLDETIKNAKNDGYVTTMFGRRRPIPELKSGNYMQRQFGERVAMNSPVQGSAADIIKIAMLRVDKALKDANLKAKIVLQIHDELLVEAPPEEKEEAARILKAEMKSAANLSVPLEVNIGSGENWFEAH